MKVLIMGLPGSGKTCISGYITDLLQSFGKTVTWLNADRVRLAADDWDFSVDGRIRQSVRMRDLADAADTDFVLCDFVAPLAIMRENFDADFTVWVDTLDHSMFDDTNKLFVAPHDYDIRVKEQDYLFYGKIVADILYKLCSKQHPEVLQKQ